jgi:hypothetical protein
MTTTAEPIEPMRSARASSSIGFGEQEARTILLIRALEEEPSQTHISKDKFEEATRIYAQSMADPTRSLFSKAWGSDFLRPRAESLYRMAVSDHQVYRHFVDPHPSSGRLVWIGAAAAALLTASADRWIYHDQINVVSLTLLLVLLITWAGIGLVIYSEIAWSRAKPADGIWSRSASWLARALHRIPGARPVSPFVVARFQDLWLRAAERLFIARLQLAMQIIGLGLIGGAAIGLLIGGATRSVPVYWGSTWFGSETMYLAFRTITVPGHLAHAVLGKEPMTFSDFVLLNREDGAATTVAPEGFVFRASQPVRDGRAPVTSRHDDLKSKWLSLVMWSLAVGALLPRLLAAIYVARKARRLRTHVLLDLSDSYFKSLQRQTIAYQRQPVSDRPEGMPAIDKKVWWKPQTWFRKTCV